jgi:hypothetical protein
MQICFCSCSCFFFRLMEQLRPCLFILHTYFKLPSFLIQYSRKLKNPQYPAITITIQRGHWRVARAVRLHSRPNVSWRFHPFHSFVGLHVGRIVSVLSLWQGIFVTLNTCSIGTRILQCVLCSNDFASYPSKILHSILPIHCICSVKPSGEGFLHVTCFYHIVCFD